MVDFTRHNDLERMAQGTESWRDSMNTNFGLIEQGATIKGIAGLTVLAAEVGYLTNDFKFEKAIAGAVGTTASEWAGFFTNDIPQDIEGYARHTGYITSPDWSFTAGPVYLSDSIAGAVTQTAPTNIYLVGFAIQTNEILIKPWTKPPEPAIQAGEGHITFFPFNNHSVVGGTWEFNMTTSQLMNYRYLNTPPVDGDELNFKVFLSAGTYTFKLVGVRDTNKGILELTFDGIPKGTIDLYGTFSWNYQATITGATVSTSGVKDVNLRLNGKNASSSNYSTHLTSLALWRTA